MEIPFIIIGRKNLRTQQFYGYHRCTYTNLSQSRNYSNYDAWKHLTPEINLRSVVQHSNEGVCTQGENDFDLSTCEKESFTARYVRGLYRTNHPYHFLYNETHGFPMFSEQCHVIDLLLS